MRRHLFIVCSSEKEKESISKKRFAKSILAFERYRDNKKRCAPNRRRDEFSRILHRFARSLSTGKREKKRIGKVRKKETYKPQNTFQSHPISSSSKEEEEEDKNVTTRRRQQEDNEKTFNPTSDGSSQRTHSSVVSRGVRVCVKKKLSIFLPQKQTHTHTHTH